jgi:hypothetical protein
MKELKDITTSLDVSKKLKEAGYKQDSILYWWQNDCDEDHTQLRNRIPNNQSLSIHKWFVYSAPTTDELLEQLPPDVSDRWILSINAIDYDDYKEYEVGYTKYFEDNGVWAYKDKYFQDKKLPDALAEMWLYLKKEGLL